MLQDNVLIVLEPEEATTKSGLHIVKLETGAREHRVARVLSVGPGHWTGCRHCGTAKSRFISTELVAGSRILVDANAGQDYSMDLSVPRHNKSLEFQEVCGERGQFRVIRESEALAVVEEDAERAA